MSIDLVVNAELVSTLQDEIVKMESLASKEFHTVAEEQKREEASEELQGGLVATRS